MARDAPTELLQSAHKAPELRKEWGHFDQLTDAIDPHLYEVAHVRTCPETVHQFLALRRRQSRVRAEVGKT
jgi:hypothetical protein